MSDRSWMLKPVAIRAAKKCIQIVKQELGIKLFLSHEEFLQMLHEYVEMTDSRELSDAYAELLSMAGVGNVIQNLRPKGTVNNIVHMPERQKAVAGSDIVPQDTQNPHEMVELAGHSYPRWREGKEFCGMYRGQPRYH